LSSYVELPHNILIQVGTDAGFCGLFVYIMLIYRGFKVTREIRTYTNIPDAEYYSGLSKGLDAGLWGFFIAGQFVTVGYYPFMWINLALAVSLKHITIQQSKRSTNEILVERQQDSQAYNGR
jgi:putative inorganic carbon (HCO3(-)) transporter